MRSNIVQRGVIGGVIGAVVMLHGPRAAHADEREQCISSAESAQALRDEGKYRRAREQMLVCARDTCPGTVKRDCVQWLSELDRDAPSVVVVAKDGDKDIADVKVYLDGVLVADRLDGRPIAVDLGEHTLKFDRGGSVKEERVLLGAGQKSRNIAVNFGAAKGGPAADVDVDVKQEPGSLVPAIVVGSLGIIAIGTAVVVGLQGKSDVDDLQQCKPRCSESSVDSARTKLIISDIATGVGVVALGVAAYMLLTRPKGDVSPKAKVGAAQHWRFDAAPTLGGAAAGLSASF
jgi:hypothetical protein